jgi:hypothetical protein
MTEAYLGSNNGKQNAISIVKKELCNSNIKVNRVKSAWLHYNKICKNCHHFLLHVYLKVN